MKKWWILLWISGFLLLGGCGNGFPQSREMDNMALMRTLAVDQGESAGTVLVTASSARRSRGVQGESEPPLVLSAQRESIAGACRTISSMSDSDVFFGHVDQLLLGEALARSGGILDALEHFSRESELGLRTRVWMIRENMAQKVLQSAKEQGAEPRLTALMQDSQLDLTGMECTAGKILTRIMEGEYPWIPALVLNEESGSLKEQGYGILKNGVLAFWVEGNAARGLALSQGNPGDDLIELAGGVVQLDSASLTCVPVMEGERLTGLVLDLRLLGRMKLPGTLGRNGLEKAVQKKTAGWLKEALDLAQETQTDFMGLARMAGLSKPEMWQEIASQWAYTFPELDIQVCCTAKLSDEKE